jgi:hypothetical protein
MFISDHGSAGTGDPSGPISLVTASSWALLSHLEAEFGPDAFAAFWSSDQRVEVAFESAFGVHPAEWVQGHATRLNGTLRAGPAPAGSTVAMALLLMLASLGIGTRAALRRRTG